MSLLDIFDEMDSMDNRNIILKPPFIFHGGKSKHVQHIIPHLPNYSTYVEPFGGSAAVLLARPKCKLEVYNDRHSGLVSFYKCLRDHEKMERMVEWLDLTICSREDFFDFKSSWVNAGDDVERAAKWYYMVMYSFGSHGRNWGRSVTANACHAGRIHKRLELFPQIHDRFKNVQVENLDFQLCMFDYDSPETVFYVDSPYYDVYSAYRGSGQFTNQDHIRMLKTIFQMKGFVAVSGYPNELYDNFPWSDKFTWEAISTARSPHENSSGDTRQYRSKVTECLWIKERY